MSLCLLMVTVGSASGESIHRHVFGFVSWLVVKLGHSIRIFLQLVETFQDNDT
ncbi:hypothetical protein M758_UG161400 [Ceratodon purpureus]|nr:hypothetical protein M758_UG161400 [Ceratodon purpureus]